MSLPRFVSWLLRMAAPDAWRDSIAGDLEEERARRAARRQASGAIWVIVAAVLTLSLGVGANAAVFSLTWHLLLAPLPWPQADRLVHVWNTARASGAINVLAPANYLDIAAEATTLETIAAYTFFNYSLNLTGAGEPIEARLRAVTADYFRVMGMPPHEGRVLSEADTMSNAPVIVLSHGLWRQHFGGRLESIGSRVQLDGRSYEIVGVMPPHFDASDTSIGGWVPYVMTPELASRRQGFFLGAVARLKPGVTVNEARAEIAAIAAQAGVRHPTTNQHIGATVRSIREELAGDVQGSIVLVAACAALVLLIAAVNLASLQVVRTRTMARATAIRAAVGASGGRLLRLALVESTLIGAAAAALGLVAGGWTVGILAGLAPPTLRMAADPGLDAVVVGVTLVVSLFTAIAVGAAASWASGRIRGCDALRGRGPIGDVRPRWSVLTPQVALATGLLVVALTLVVSLANVLRTELGFNPDDLVAVDLRLPPSRYPTPALQTAFFTQLLDAIAPHPQVAGACATNTVPFEQAANMTYVPDGTERLIGALPVTVTPDCFATLQIPLVSGRLFRPHEDEPVAIVSTGYAARAWPGDDAVGRMIRIGLPTGERLRIVGLVADSRRVSLERDPFPQVYQPAAQSRFFVPTRLLVRSSASPDTVAAVIRSGVRAIDPSQPVGQIRHLQDLVDRSTSTRRLTASLVGGFALIAGLLAAIGIYSLLAHMVVRRRPEIGIRLALGARPGAVIRLMTSRAVAPVGIGIAVGLLGAWLASRLVAPLVFGISATDPRLYLGAATSLMVLAVLAAVIPVRRAAQVDPVAVLRDV